MPTGSSVGYISGTDGRPLPKAGDQHYRTTHTPVTPKPRGIDFNALRPKCTDCGQPSGQLDDHSRCPTCRGVQAKATPTAPTKGSHTYAHLSPEDIAERFYAPSHSLEHDLGELQTSELPQEGNQGKPTTRTSAPGATTTSSTTGRAPDAGSSTTERKDPLAGQETRPAPASGPTLDDLNLEAQIAHAGRVLRATAPATHPAIRLLRLNVLSAIEALHLLNELTPQTAAAPAPGRARALPVRGDGGTPEGGAPAGKPARPPAPPRPRQPRASTCNTRNPIDEQAVIHAYQEGQTPPVLAEQHGCTPKRIREIVARAGITLRDDRKGHSGSRKYTTLDDHPELRDQAITRYAAGESTVAIARDLNTSAKHVNSVLRRAGIELRPKANIGRTITEAEIQQAVDRYTAGDSIKNIAVDLHIKITRARALLADQGVEIRGPGGTIRTFDPDAVTPAQIRTWAVTQGLLAPGLTGRLPQRVIDAYTEAHDTSTPTEGDTAA